jgi:hypothetical protein
VLSTVRSSSGGSGEGWLRVKVILAREGRGPDRISSRGLGRRWGSSTSRGFGRGEGITANSGEEQCGGGSVLMVAGKKKGGNSREGELGSVL